MKIIHKQIYNPKNSIFKSPANTRCSLSTIWCSESERCELFKNKACTRVKLFVEKCPHGKNHYEEGPTRRANSYNKTINQWSKSHKDIPTLEYPKDKMARVGDYIYLPYAHMTMNTNIPFTVHENIFVKGQPFLHQDHWNPATILSILNFKPMSLMGREITNYQQEEIPKFLNHLIEFDIAMFNQLLASESIVKKYGLDKPRNYIGRLAKLSTLNYPLRYTTDGYNGKYIIEWYWNGEKLTTHDKIALDSWSKIKNPQSLTIEVIPSADHTIRIQDNNWVNEKTEFID